MDLNSSDMTADIIRFKRAVGKSTERVKREPFCFVILK